MMQTDTARTRREINRKRNTLLACGYTPANMAAALLQSEIRQYLRALNPAERDALLETAAPDVWLAVILAPAFLSGVSVESINALREKYVHAVHGDEWADLERQQAELDREEATV